MVEGGQFLGKDHGVVLRNDQDAGAQAKGGRRGRHIGEPDKGVRDQRVVFPGHHAVFGVGIGGFDAVGPDHVFTTPD